MKKERTLTACLYAFIHFAVEVICFYSLYRFLPAEDTWWTVALLYDTLAFAPQSVIGRLAERFPNLRPGALGGVLLLAGAGICWLGGRFSVQLAGLVVLAIGNCFVHIAGALATLRVSEGRLSESAVFVGGGSFGVITGRLLGAAGKSFAVPLVLMLLAIAASLVVDSRLRRRYGEAAFRFDVLACRHDLAADRPLAALVLLPALVIMVRAYIGYYLPTSWNQTKVQTVFLFCTMGAGKMLGGILADRFGARRVGVVSCLLAVPALLLSDRIMWLSLIGVALFSMTMAITLGGLVSVLPQNPGVAFGITTIGLLLGTVPPFFLPAPPRLLCNILIAALSVLAALVLGYCLKKPPLCDEKPERSVR